MKIFESGALKECIISWGDTWGSGCKNHKEGISGYGGCRYWEYTDFYKTLKSGVEVRHPGYCKYRKKFKFEDFLNKELFEI